jgi:hypothetical protein
LAYRDGIHEPKIRAGNVVMRFKQYRARRIAAIRRQLADLGGERPSADHDAPPKFLECGGRGHLISVASWLISSYLRILHAAQSRTPTRSDYLLDWKCRLPASRRRLRRWVY